MKVIKEYKQIKINQYYSINYNDHKMERCLTRSNNIRCNHHFIKTTNENHMFN